MSRASTSTTSITSPGLKVWDLFVRVFHWSLVAGVTAAAFTGFVIGARSIDIHVWIGAALAALVFVRLLWGLFGTGFARFSSFVVGPRAVLSHVGKLRDGTAARHVGHNPLGGWMVLTLLAAIVMLAATGAIGLGGVFRHGPLKALFDYDESSLILLVHWWIAVFLLALVGLHIAGAVYESLRSHENLIRAMITGRKQTRTGDHLPPHIKTVRARPVLTIALTAPMLIVPVALSVTTPRSHLARTPVAVAGTPYAANCTDCHAAYAPSLLPAKSWKKLMAGLGSHFGEDASLAPATVAKITAWLTAHSAGTVDTKPAHVFRKVSALDPTRITAAPFWQKTHARIPKKTFTTPPVYSAGNCSACHQDATTGWFYPGKIEIPHAKANPS